jgi:hypothetical protein
MHTKKVFDDGKMEFLTFITVCKSDRPITFYGENFDNFSKGIEASLKFCLW